MERIGMGVRLEEGAKLARRKFGVDVRRDPEEAGGIPLKPIGRGEGDIVVGGVGWDSFRGKGLGLAGRRRRGRRWGEIGVERKGAWPRGRDGPPAKVTKGLELALDLLLGHLGGRHAAPLRPRRRRRGR